MLKLLIRSEDSCRTGVLIPVPTYASFTLALEEQGAAIVPYYLCEEQGWMLQVEELRRALHTGRKTCKPVALYICNPGNPTGTVDNNNITIIARNLCNLTWLRCVYLHYPV